MSWKMGMEGAIIMQLSLLCFTYLFLNSSRCMLIDEININRFAFLDCTSFEMAVVELQLVVFMHFP